MEATIQTNNITRFNVEEPTYIPTRDHGYILVSPDETAEIINSPEDIENDEFNYVILYKEEVYVVNSIDLTLNSL
jgi:hypothetical protein